jgi:hypothetical protein
MRLMAAIFDGKREATDDKFLSRSRQYLSFPTIVTRNVREVLIMSTTPD